MPHLQLKKRNSDKDSLATLQCEESNSSSTTSVNAQVNNSGGSNSPGKSRKRKRCEVVRFSDLESEFEDCDLEDAAALENKLRKVARRNSLTHDEMMKLLHKFVKNEHILALVTLKAEDELAKEKLKQEEQRAIIITETPSVPKLTRAKARELNKTPIVAFPPSSDQEQPEIASLIKDDLHSDEEDEEYVFKEEDFVSDDDRNTIPSDLESNPRTPLTPGSQIEDSPAKLTDDGCFKVPLSKKKQELYEELRIAARTRSKLCLQQTTIEDLQSGFVPPDVEDPLEPSDTQILDKDWMQFLNDFNRPLNTSLVTDDDDPINDPEYVAAEKEPVDAEELRDVNISKKELSALIAELYDGLTMEEIDLETPRKFLESNQYDGINTPNTSSERSNVNLEVSKQFQEVVEAKNVQETQQQFNNVTSTNINLQDYTFHPDIVSTPSTHNNQHTNNNNNNNDNNNNSEYNNYYNNKIPDNMTLIPVARSLNDTNDPHNATITIASNALNTELELIAVPIPGQPNHFQLAKVVVSPEQSTKTSKETQNEQEDICTTSKNTRYSVPYEINYTCEYVSVRRHIIAEYIDKFKSLKHAQDNKISSTTTDSTECNPNANTGFTHYQYNLMQQQLRIHVQQLTQTFVQTYCHPEFWTLAHKPRDMLLELQTKSNDNSNFKIWNLEPAVDLIKRWQEELDEDTPENTELMRFLHREIYATNHNSRQIPRFHPRIMDCYLNSPVFMYPQYLPRMPFSPKAKIHAFSPAESYLIAMGLEKHLKIIYEKKERVPSKSSPLRMACKRLCKDTLCGKRFRRVWDYILHLQKVEYYNPIKYFFEHNRAPPVEYEPIITFENNTVLPPKDRIPELPLVFQTYLQEKSAPPKFSKTKKSNARSSSSTSSKVKVSEAFKNSYIEFVREALGQDVPIPNNLEETNELNDISLSDADVKNNCVERKKSSKPATKKRLPQSFTINVNYVFGNGVDPSNAANLSLSALPAPTYSIENSTENVLNAVQTNNFSIDNSVSNLTNLTQTNQISSNNNFSLPDSTINSITDTTQKTSNNSISYAECPIITYNFDLKTNTLQPVFDITQTDQVPTQCSSKPEESSTTHKSPEKQEETVHCYSNKPKVIKKFRKHRKICSAFKLSKKIKQKASTYREKRHLQKRCEDLITAYSIHLETIQLKYKHHLLIQHYYRHFKALELYTNLLIGLKSICNIHCATMSSSSNNSPSNLKRARNSNSNTEDDNNPSSVRQVRKLNRQEENFRHMLLPDTPDEANRKDAIYAFNFYEKVEEAFKASNRPEDCKKFNAILKSFDPKIDKVSDLYYKLEKLFLPDHPELAQVFLTFLLPSEAAEIGKFFEHFMINNMTTFINKLNIYFNKQPAQIRKIYNCLNDLAEDPDVTMKKVEAKILPLLKGNQFLIDWFMQQFPQNTPPERLFSTPEHIINLKDQQSNRSGEYVETLIDLMDSPTNDTQQQQSCQLRYINGRIFYGSKMLLPAKLSFMAASYKDKNIENDTIPASLECVHGIREHGEKRLQAATDLTSTHCSNAELPSSDDQDKSEEEDVSKALVIDTTADEDDSCSSIEQCDEATLRAHALRLNPTVYSSTCYSSATATSTPNFTNNFQAHHPNAKKTSINFNEEAKLSPRKNLISSSTSHQQSLNSPLSILCSSPLNTRDKRKSPIKKTKSPLNNSKTLRTGNTNGPVQQSTVTVNETNSAIQCAKRLKSLIDEDESQQQSETTEETTDTKDIMQIAARSKTLIKSSASTVAACQPTCKEVKDENADDLEFLAEGETLSPSPFPCLRLDTDSNEEDLISATTPPPPPQPPSSAVPVSDEDSKIDIVTSLTTSTSPNEISSSSSSAEQKSNISIPLHSAWTRDEDKIILIEMKLGSQNRQELYQRIAEKLSDRTMYEITARHQFLMDFLSKLQGK